MKDLIIAILGISVIAIFMSKKIVKENFWGLPNRTVYADKEYGIKNSCDGNMVLYSVPPNYQSMLEPRFSNVNYGANIKYNLPCQDQLGAPDYPLTFQGDVRESYEPNSKISNCENIKNFVEDARLGTIQSSEEIIPQVVNYDRLIYANQRSRLYGRGDPIRGDLPIVPINDGWFRPNVHPNVDLRQGAINVIAGSENCTANAVRALQAEYSGKTALAQKDISLGAAQGDIVVTAFP